MNTTTTKIAEAAMTDEQIIEMAKAHCVDATRISTVLSFARALLASKPAVAPPVDEKAEWQAFLDWAWKKEGEAIGRMEGRDAVWAGWHARAMLAASPTAPAQSCGQAEFGTARERFISGAPVQASEHVLELARQALAARDSDTRTDDEKIAAAVDFICDTRLDQPVKCGDAEQADERNDGEEAMQAAAATLPAAYDLRIYLERGAGWVELYDPDGKPVEFDEDTDSGMAGSIRAATAEAIEHARAKDSK
jgi:hypothetical protein